MEWASDGCSNGPGHMNKMAAMSIDSTNLTQSSQSRPEDRWH